MNRMVNAQVPGRRVLVASGQGGHLAELYQLLPRMLPMGRAAEWVTIDTPHSRSLLAGKTVAFLRPVAPRDAHALLATLPPAARILRGRRYDTVIASGNVALAFLPLAEALGMSGHFIECATRTEAPSLSGRLLGAVPGARRYTQHPRWARGSWLYRGSVFDNYEPEERRVEPRLRRVVVTLGMNPYPFRRLIERLLMILPSSVDVIWQSGVTPIDGLPIRARAVMSARHLDDAMAGADVVVAHAGTGSSIAALEAGHIPVLVPRRQAHGEQVDDHQVPLADELSQRGLGVATSVESLDLATLRLASTRRARRRDSPPRFELA
jgi:UDP-N-acetylglucosamine--N-acetylmuramyl-(pentapeptide) pyrophosphoryl-undecaprenol N-acetylglucosamine transferase